MAGHGSHGRKFFYALPKHDRDRQLTQMFRAEYEKFLSDHMGDVHAEFRMKFKFCGFDVCRKAFMLLTGTCPLFLLGFRV